MDELGGYEFTCYDARISCNRHYKSIIPQTNTLARRRRQPDTALKHTLKLGRASPSFRTLYRIAYKPSNSASRTYIPALGHHIAIYEYSVLINACSWLHVVLFTIRPPMVPYNYYFVRPEPGVQAHRI